MMLIALLVLCIAFGYGMLALAFYTGKGKPATNYPKAGKPFIHYKK